MIKLGLDFYNPFDTLTALFLHIKVILFPSLSSFSSKCLPSVGLLPVSTCLRCAL